MPWRLFSIIEIPLFYMKHVTYKRLSYMAEETSFHQHIFKVAIYTVSRFLSKGLVSDARFQEREHAEAYENHGNV